MYRKMVMLMVGMVGFSAAWALDEAAAEALARKSGCLKCHAMDKKKDGPALKEIAGKWKNKPDAIAKLSTHITTAPKVKIDGKEEDHEVLKSKDPADVKNVVEWVLSR
ncbi:c-type cytochrome [Denitratisoma oestradiolicum]|uniref:Class I cytochrome c n=1 Tax=Denitratisoma oestradiolicum TaxID=311182 RepID=A0A6S6XXW7_9PROT|nr:c-type cytochrome [Denitratisoma oestradiolicum]TWO80620.1 class I cytochrome c [Denitratisoma oestradiolicum]CAB1367699.1 Class I cytochrome c [Denitratisoma oestradiolicum]